MAGKAIKNDKQKAAVLGSIAGAQHVRCVAFIFLGFGSQEEGLMDLIFSFQTDGQTLWYPSCPPQ
jgi:hypothetical protein